MGRSRHYPPPAVVIQVEHAVTPAALGQCRRSHAALPRDLLKKAAACVAKQRHGFLDQSGFEKVGPGVVINIASVSTHTGDCRAVLGVSHAALDSNRAE